MSDCTVTRVLLCVIQLKANMPRQTAHSRNCLELMNNIPRNEVNVIVIQLNPGIADAFSPQLIEFCIINPLNTLEKKNTGKTFAQQNLSEK